MSEAVQIFPEEHVARLREALSLAAEGFWIFPLIPGGKTPSIKDWPNEATRDAEKIKAWWRDGDWNIGIYTGRFQDERALVVVDVDNKKGKPGDETIVQLEFDGHEFPRTRIHSTPSGGRHLVYAAAVAIRQGTNKLGMGLDIRSRGGYIVGPRSRVAAGLYGNDGSPLTLVPGWIEARCGESRTKRVRDNRGPVGVDHDRAILRAVRYLREEAPLAVEGARNEMGYRAAAVLKDFGVPEDEAPALMRAHWQCNPMLDAEEVDHVVHSAYRYTNDDPGSAAPETVFDKISVDHKEPVKLDPVAALNLEFAYVNVGGGDHILWETTDHKGQNKLEHLNIGAFHRRFLSKKIPIGKKQVPITEEWMSWSGRRGYDGIVFSPEQKAPDRFYNLWRGFAVQEPADADLVDDRGHKSLAMFLEHAKENICQNDETLFKWLMGYFAHMIQRPWEKPLVALVFRGGKGTGKNALVHMVGRLLGPHYLLTSNKRFLIGNFNGHLENLLMFVLDEAFWSGDKQAEGTLKDLVTGHQHVIEHKGEGTYTVDNLTRPVIIGNEKWIVPASHDERRYAVFQVGNARKQDKKFFAAMHDGMINHGGDGLLLRYLRGIDLTDIDVNQAPSTEALLDQKLSSFDPVFQWWNQCLTEVRLVGSDFSEGWPVDVDFDLMRGAYRKYCHDRGIGGRVPEARAFEQSIMEGCPSITKRKVKNVSQYIIPPLPTARREWSAFVGHAVQWPKD